MDRAERDAGRVRYSAAERDKRVNEMTTLLIIEDDLDMNNALCIYFEKENYKVFQAFNSAEAEKYLKEADIHLIIADIGLPGESGLHFIRRLSVNKKIPVVFLTAKDEEEDILKGYDTGCEEYITKPISPKILQKKLETILKRNIEYEGILYYKEMKIDHEKRKVWIRDTEIKLTSKEWKIFEVLTANKGKIITKEILLHKIWDIDENFVDEHVVTVVINRLRKKIEVDTKAPVYIKNVFGVGYTFGE